MRGDERGLVARLDDVVGYDFVEGEDGGAEGGAVGVAVGEEEGFHWGGGVRGEGGGRRWGERGGRTVALFPLGTFAALAHAGFGHGGCVGGEVDERERWRERVRRCV